MKLLDSLQRRFGRFAVPNLALLIVMGQGMVLLMGWISRPQPGQAGLVETWSLQGSQVLEGQWWRLLTFVLVPPGTGILVVFGLYLFLLMGGALEARWGAFRFNVYLVLGWGASIAGAFLQPDAPASVGYLGGSVFLAFAWLFPDFQLLLMFIIPVRIKFLAWITWIVFGWTLVSSRSTGIERLLVLAAVFNFLVFFVPDILIKIRSGQRRQQRTREQRRTETVPFHRCTVCDLTEKDDPQMLFRFCSLCQGEREYCEKHLRDHSHVGDA